MTMSSLVNIAKDCYSQSYVRLPVASLRAKPNRQAELISQEVVGRRVEILRCRGDWLKCRLRDGYLGWLPRRAVAVDPDFMASHFVVSRFVRMRSTCGKVILPLGSVVKAKRSGKSYEIYLPGGQVGFMEAGKLRSLRFLPFDSSQYRRLVREVAGAPYLWGGKTPFGFDCSGLVQVIFDLMGVMLPRNSRDQARIGKPIESIHKAQVLDLLFFAHGANIDHVAIYLGELRFLHASDWVKIESLREGDPCYRGDLLASLVEIRRTVL